MDVTFPSMSTMPTKLGVAMAGLGLRVFVVSGRGQTRRQNSHPQGSNRSMELDDAKGIRHYSGWTTSSPQGEPPSGERTKGSQPLVLRGTIPVHLSVFGV